MGRRLPLIALLVAGCGLTGCTRDDAPRPLDRPSIRHEDDPLATPAPPTGPPAMIFDTTEPPPATVEIPVPEPPPAPDPAPPPPTPPPAPGSCDVRGTESFCFAYTGSGWTADDAETQCGEAPDSRYRTGPCPTAGQIARCTFRRASDPTLELVYTYYAPYDLTLAEVACPGDFERL